MKPANKLFTYSIMTFGLLSVLGNSDSPGLGPKTTGLDSGRDHVWVKTTTFSNVTHVTDNLHEVINIC